MSPIRRLEMAARFNSLRSKVTACIPDIRNTDVQMGLCWKSKMVSLVF